jgi:hypothetical protein
MLHTPCCVGASAPCSEIFAPTLPTKWIPQCKFPGYDCTGLQFIDAGTALINGERVSLDLQIAEGGGNP